MNTAGVAAKWVAQGHHVKFVSTTNGDIGHWREAGGPLARRRISEVRKAAKILGVETEVLDIHDGELEPTLENRKKIIRLIREWRADVVLTHHAFDYHPDHRYTSQLVQDAAFMVAVPFASSTTPPLKKNPVFLYYGYREYDHPLYEGRGLAVSIDDVWQRHIDALNVLVSQFDEGGALGSAQRAARVPDDAQAKAEYYRNKWTRRYQNYADKHRDLLIKWYGEQAGKHVQRALTFQVCIFGGRPNDDELRKLFPFFTDKK